MKKIAFIICLIISSTGCTIDDEDFDIQNKETDVLLNKNLNIGREIADPGDSTPPELRENPIQGNKLIVYVDYNDFFNSQFWLSTNLDDSDQLTTTVNTNTVGNIYSPEEVFMNGYVLSEGNNYEIYSLSTTQVSQCGYVQRWEVNLNQYFQYYPSVPGLQPQDTTASTVRQKPEQPTVGPPGENPVVPASIDWITYLPYSVCF